MQIILRIEHVMSLEIAASWESTEGEVSYPPSLRCILSWPKESRTDLGTETIEAEVSYLRDTTVLLISIPTIRRRNDHESEKGRREQKKDKEEREGSHGS